MPSPGTGAGMPAYSKVTRHGQITLPSSVRKELGIEEGDLATIAISMHRNSLLRLLIIIPITC